MEENKNEEIKEEKKAEEPKEHKKEHKKDKKLEELQNEINALKDKNMRIAAEMVNTLRRKDEETNRLLKYSNESLITELLPVIDNFERALNVDAKTVDVESYCESLENFLAHGFGVCLVKDGEVVSEAYAPYVTTKNIELATLTKESHRGRGYAAITCAHFIQACQARSLAPYWSCDADNAASAKLARKLGFKNEREYEILMYRGMQK